MGGRITQMEEPLEWLLDPTAYLPTLSMNRQALRAYHRDRSVKKLRAFTNNLLHTCNESLQVPEDYVGGYSGDSEVNLRA